MNTEDTCLRISKSTTFELIKTSIFQFIILYIGLAILGAIFNYIGLFDPMTFYFWVGFYCSTLATYYKYKIYVDP